jgi:hypothetical protein
MNPSTPFTLSSNQKHRKHPCKITVSFEQHNPAQ